MLSRIADHIFWMGRYLERADNTARLLAVVEQYSLLPVALDEIERNWMSVLNVYELQSEFDDVYKVLDKQSVAKFMALDMQNAFSVMSSVNAARENARAVRAVISSSVWEAINHTWLQLSTFIHQSANELQSTGFYKLVGLRTQAIHGVVIDGMYRDEVFTLFTLGTLLERAENIARMMDVKFVMNAAKSVDDGMTTNVSDHYFWLTLLETVSSLEDYRRATQKPLDGACLAEFIIENKGLPRSIASCLDQIQVCLETLAQQEKQYLATVDRDAILLTRSQIRQSQSKEPLKSLTGLDTDVNQIVNLLRKNKMIDAAKVHIALCRLIERLNELGRSIQSRYLRLQLLSD